MAKQGIMVEIIVNYYTPQGRVWVYHQDVHFTAEVRNKWVMRLLESDIAQAIPKRGKLLHQESKP